MGGDKLLNSIAFHLQIICFISGEASKQIHEYKLKLQKADQDITNLDGTVSLHVHYHLDIFIM